MMLIEKHNIDAIIKHLKRNMPRNKCDFICMGHSLMLTGVSLKENKCLLDIEKAMKLKT